MIRALTSTSFSKAIAAGFNLLIMSLAGRNLGAEGIGTISLIILAITIIMLVNNLVGGGALTYLAPRFAVKRLIGPTYLWALFTALIAWLLVKYLGLVPDEYEFHVVILAFMQSLYTIHLNILLGKERLRLFNILVSTQVVVLFLVFWILVKGSDTPTPMDYITASYVAFGLTLVMSGIGLLWYSGDSGSTGDGLLKKLFAQGGFIQMANLFQLMNYRLSYYVIQNFMGMAPLGVFSVGTQLSEGSWIVPKSIGTVLYMKVSNENDERARRQFTIGLMHLSMIITVLVLAGLWLLPDAFYQWVFGEGISGVSTIIRYLSIGIIAMAGSQALSHYFSGTARNEQNTIASGIGLMLTLVLAFILIPAHGLIGAAVTASIAYSGLFLYQVFSFVRLSGSRIGDLIPNPASINRMIALLSSDKVE